MVRKVLHDPAGDREPIRAAIEREVHPRVRVPLFGSGGKVRWVREDSIEPTEPAGEVGPDHRDRPPGVPRPIGERCERVAIAVRRDDGPSRARGGEARGAVPGADLEQAARAPTPRDPHEELGVVPDRIYGEPTLRIRPAVGS
jgi:hypothetical protein